MNLFIFGSGYTVGQFINHYRDRFTRVSGTFYSLGTAESLQASGIIPYAFGGASYDTRILEELARADALLISIPPLAGPNLVLQQFGTSTTSARCLGWVGYLSTVGVYGNANSEWVDEDSPLNPLNERSRNRLVTKRQWLDLGDSAPFAVQVFRLAGIYGPRRNTLRRIAEGTVRRLIKPGQVFNRIHTNDIAQVVMASVECPGQGRVYNVADDEPGPPQDVIRIHLNSWAVILRPRCHSRRQVSDRRRVLFTGTPSECKTPASEKS
jgi:hypothetical protein